MRETRVLVVEDDVGARQLIVDLLELDGYSVQAVNDGEAALNAVEHFRPDGALIDGNLPGLCGREVARRLRQSSDIPIIFVTACDTIEERRAAFAVGGDDYIVKPFDTEELLWRLRAALRRSGHAVASVWEIADIVIDEPRHRVARAGVALSLTNIEYKLLVALVRRRDRVVTKSQLLGEVWGGAGDYKNDNVVEVHMSSLRRKLEAHGPRLIQTERGCGYVIRPSAERAGAPTA